MNTYRRNNVEYSKERIRSAEVGGWNVILNREISVGLTEKITLSKDWR